MQVCDYTGGKCICVLSRIFSSVCVCVYMKCNVMMEYMTEYSVFFSTHAGMAERTTEIWISVLC